MVCIIVSSRTFDAIKHKFSIVVETDQSWSPAQLLQSFARDHRNPIRKEIKVEDEIGQLARMPGGNLRLFVTSEKFCQKLAYKKVFFRIGIRYSWLRYPRLNNSWIFSESDRNYLHPKHCIVLAAMFCTRILAKHLIWKTRFVFFGGYFFSLSPVQRLWWWLEN